MKGGNFRGPNLQFDSHKKALTVTAYPDCQFPPQSCTLIETLLQLDNVAWPVISPADSFANIEGYICEDLKVGTTS